MPASHAPRATYRVQLHAGFTLDDAAAIVDYLDALGIEYLYCSPYLQARAGSSHGYDVVNHGTISEELGGPAAHDRLVDALAQKSMGHLLDVVPNHMTIADRRNRWWWEVLRDGPESRFASYFDIEWDPPGEKLDRKVLIPILGADYDRVLDAGELRLDTSDGETVVRYFEHVLPVNERSLRAAARADESSSDLIQRARNDPALLHEILERQHYRLAYWRTAARELNYRRFFAINDLVALRMENPEVFDDVHALVLRLVGEGRLQGLRIDHIDGLSEPEHYLERLRANAGDAYVVVEKILEPAEELPRSWPVQGTTGYDFLNILGGVFIDPSGEKPLTDLYADFTGERSDVAELVRAKKLLLMDTELAPDLERITELFARVRDADPRLRDYTRPELRDTLAETVAAFPVYRTYVSARDDKVTEQDERLVREAIETARDRRGDLAPELFDLLADVLLLRVPGEAAGSLAMRFQQLTGPVMAKGVEDTFFYVYNRFAALNEVGGDPRLFGVEPDEFHRSMETAARHWPHSMLATSTHDTKRSEDVRARMSLLSEIPEPWGESVERWSDLAGKHRTGALPDRNMEYLLWQTLVGAWPISTERMTAYMAKASKEAKVHTSWIEPDPTYDDALRSFVENVMADETLQREIGSFVEPLVRPGRVTSLAQTLVKLTAPGVPDLYQGQELWDLSLVDPDNRCPVDYALRRALLEDLDDASPEAAWAAAERGGPKLLVTQRALRLRRDRPLPFEGDYRPLPVSGSKARHAIAYVRGGEVVTVAPRLVLSLAGDWADTSIALPEGSWRDVFTDRTFAGGDVPLGDLLARFEVALLRPN